MQTLRFDTLGLLILRDPSISHLLYSLRTDPGHGIDGKMATSSDYQAVKATAQRFFAHFKADAADVAPLLADIMGYIWEELVVAKEGAAFLHSSEQVSTQLFVSYSRFRFSRRRPKRKQQKTFKRGRRGQSRKSLLQLDPAGDYNPGGS